MLDFKLYHDSASELGYKLSWNERPDRSGPRSCHDGAGESFSAAAHRVSLSIIQVTACPDSESSERESPV